MPELKAGQARLAIGAILAWSLALGGLCLYQYRTSPFLQWPIIDEISFVEWAEDIARGHVLGHEIFYLDPLYPYLLALILKIGGGGLLAPRVVQVLLGAGTVLLVFVSARKLLGETAGVIAALTLALYHGLYYYELLLLKAIIETFLAAACCALSVYAADRPASWPRWIAFGFVAALITLTRGNFLLLLPPLALVPLAISARGPAAEGHGLVPILKRRGHGVGAVALGMALAIVPVTVRNYAVGGELVLTTSQGGANFYIGNNPIADGRYRTLPFVRAHPRFEAGDFKAEAEQRAGRALTSSQVSRFWFGEALRWMESDPAAAAKLTLRKARMLIHDYEVPDNHNFYSTREEFSPALYAAFLGFGTWWGPAALGAWYLARRDRRSWAVTAIGVLYPLTIIPFFIVARYRMVMVPSVAILVGAFAVWLADALKSKNWRALAGGGVFLAIAMALGHGPIAASRDLPAIEYLVIGNAYAGNGRPADALPWYDRALAALPPGDEQDLESVTLRRQVCLEILELMAQASVSSDVEALLKSGARLEELAQPKLAAEVYERVVTLDPGRIEALARLGDLYCANRDSRNLAAGVKRLQAAMALIPPNPDAMAMMGQCDYAQGEDDQARTWFERALQIDPDHATARSMMEKLK